MSAGGRDTEVSEQKMSKVGGVTRDEQEREGHIETEVRGRVGAGQCLSDVRSRAGSGLRPVGYLPL